MDYAIYKDVDGKYTHIVHRFTQEACNHRAKLTAKAKLNEMWLRLLQHPTLARNATGTPDWFAYDHYIAADITERIRFSIAPLK